MAIESPLGDQTEWPEYLEWVIYGYMIIAVFATLLIAWKINRDIAKFSFFYTFLLALDIGTDLKMVLVLWVYEDQPSWAMMSLFWVWVPFLIHLMKLFYSCAPNPQKQTSRMSCTTSHSSIPFATATSPSSCTRCASDTTTLTPRTGLKLKERRKKLLNRASVRTSSKPARRA